MPSSSCLAGLLAKPPRGLVCFLVMITKFSTLYVGHIELEHCGLSGTPADDRRAKALVFLLLRRDDRAAVAL